MKFETRNLLIASLADDDLSLIAPHLERVELGENEVLASAGGAHQSACFLESGIASHALISGGGKRTGIGIVGHEGFVGWEALLGGGTSPYEVSVTVGGGTALRVAHRALALACERSPALHRLLLRFAQTFTIQVGHTALSNLEDPVEQRLARWLLMNHDRLEGDEIVLTHQEIGRMLSVRRASVTDALHALEGRGLIRSSRRLIVIRDRAGLRDAAGENYGGAEAEYGKLIRPFGKGG